MNVAQARPRLWSPQVILFAVVLHVAVLYYVAVAFKVVPPPVDLTPDATPIVTFRPTPPPPVLEVDPIKPEPPRFRPHAPVTPPLQVDVPPVPFPPAPPAESTADATTIGVNAPIEEVPVAQALPRYPTAALERGIEGRVIMSITIMPDGSVRDVQVVSAQPRGYFEATAVRAVQGWRYRPSNVVRTNVIVHMDFELRDG
ncbi:MAG: energy transducer TonB [Alphaproteobacteria bacterium]|nr:energy transducer TonB [Alphaproteobacteria bacterium]